MSKQIFILAIIIFALKNSEAQIGGLSASKLSTLSAETVAQNSIEFEPYFGYSLTKSIWTHHHSRISTDTCSCYKGMGFRFTYGIGEKLESGISLPADASLLQWGLKYRFFRRNKISSAFIWGIDADLENPKIISHTGGGFILTGKFSEKFGTDFNVSAIRCFDQNAYQLNIGMDNGYYFGKIQGIIGINYARAIFFDNTMKEILSVNPGITIETGKDFIIVMSVPFSVYGTNETCFAGFNFALTLTFH